MTLQHTYRLLWEQHIERFVNTHPYKVLCCEIVGLIFKEEWVEPLKQWMVQPDPEISESSQSFHKQSYNRRHRSWYTESSNRAVTLVFTLYNPANRWNLIRDIEFFVLHLCQLFILSKKNGPWLPVVIIHFSNRENGVLSWMEHNNNNNT